MNRKDRQRKLARAHAHQAQSRAKRKAHPEPKVSGRPPAKPRRRTLPKRVIRAMGRKVRPDRRDDLD